MHTIGSRRSGEVIGHLDSDVSKENVTRPVEKVGERVAVE